MGRMVQAAWYAIFGAFFISWMVFYKFNKSKNLNSVLFGIAALVMSFFVEQYGVGENLWNYTGGNWPWILWPTYFASGMLGYEISIFIRNLQQK